MTIRLLVAGICLILSSAIVADTQATSLPPIFNDSWLDLTAGFNEYGFTNDNLKPGFTAEGIQNSNPAFRISLGHNFNRYLALSVSLMRGTDWVHYLDVMPNGGHKKGVWLSLFGLTLKPMLPLGDRFTLYGEAGPGFISRHGFEIYIEPAMQSVIESAFITTPLVGGGFLYRLSEHFLLDWNILYGFPQNGQNQPFTFYTGVGLQYLFGNHDASHYVRSCEFPLNSLQLAYTNNDFFYVDAAPYFSPPSIPIFFTGSIKIENAALLQYERNFYHTAKYFSLEWGLSVGRWQSPVDQDVFYTLSAYPELKFWFWRHPFIDFYFTYSLAGPTYISRSVVDGRDMYANLTFQDFMGLGILAGEDKRVMANVKIVHYSNGNLFPDNPGIQGPVMLTLGYAF